MPVEPFEYKRSELNEPTLEGEPGVIVLHRIARACTLRNQEEVYCTIYLDVDETDYFEAQAVNVIGGD